MVERSFLKNYAPSGGLLQSDEWAQLQECSGHRVHPLSGIGFEGYVFVHHLPFFGNSLFLPRGPVVDMARLAPEALEHRLRECVGSERAAWIRVEPETEEILETLRELFGTKNIVLAPRDTNPRESLIISLEGKSGEWLGRMKSKTRYNVRLAEKHGVTVRFAHDEQAMGALLSLVYSTANRKAIAPHPKSYYRNFFRVFNEKECIIALAEKENVILAASLLIFFNETAYYLHGGSSDNQRECMAPFLLHFRSMEESQHRGCTRYDFGGVRLRSKKDVSDTDWDGITRFKQGFAPNTKTVLFPGTYDIVISPWRYRWYRALRLLRGLRKHLSLR